MTHEQFDTQEPRLQTSWRSFNDCVEALVRDDLLLLATSSEEIAASPSPFAARFKELVEDYTGDRMNADLLLESNLDDLSFKNTVNLKTGARIHDYHWVQEGLADITADIMKYGLRSYAYPYVNEYTGVEPCHRLNPGANSDVFYSAAIMAGATHADEGNWIVAALYPTPELIEEISDAKGCGISELETKFHTMNGLELLHQLGLADQQMRTELDALKKSYRRFVGLNYS